MRTKERFTNRLLEAATVLEKTSNAAGRSCGDSGLEAAGATLLDALDGLGNKIGLTPICGWLGNILKGIFSLAAVVFKAIFGMLGWMLAGLIKIIGGLLTWQHALLLDGAWDILSSALGVLMLLTGKLVALLQSLVYAQGFERALTNTEKSELARVFKGRLNYHAIRIITGHSGIFGFSPRPFALGNTIYMKTANYSPDILVHEVTHTWQYQQGAGRYASDALTAQWFIPDAYNWQREIDERHKTTWQALNKEAQAEFLRDLWRQAELRDATGTVLQKGNGSFYDADGVLTFGYFTTGDKDRSDIAGNALRTIRGECCA